MEKSNRKIVNKNENIIETSTKYSGDWLDFKTVTLKTPSNNPITNYEYTERSSKKKHIPNQDCVSIIPFLYSSSTKVRHLILEANFRPPVNSYVLEFPGGLIETDSSIEDALRELKEETGYIGKAISQINSKTPLVYFDPWKSNENTRMVVVEVDGDDEKNRNPIQNLEDTEDIKVVLIEFNKDLLRNLEEYSEKNNCKLSVELYSFAMSLSLFSSFSE